MSQPSPLIGTLVRFWENGFQNNIATQWVDWHDGYFHQYTDSPLGRMLFDAPIGRRQVLATLYSTDELVWTVKSVTVNETYGHPYMTVHCVPWLEYLRHSLMSDDYLTWLWLDAERKHQEAS